MQFLRVLLMSSVVALSACGKKEMADFQGLWKSTARNAYINIEGDKAIAYDGDGYEPNYVSDGDLTLQLKGSKLKGSMVITEDGLPMTGEATFSLSKGGKQLVMILKIKAGEMEATQSETYQRVENADKVLAEIKANFMETHKGTKPESDESLEDADSETREGDLMDSSDLEEACEAALGNCENMPNIPSAVGMPNPFNSSETTVPGAAQLPINLFN